LRLNTLINLCLFVNVKTSNFFIDFTLLNAYRPEPELFVPELCQMTGLTDEMRSNFKLMKQRAAASDAEIQERFMRIQAFKEKIDKNQESVREWALEVDNKMIEVCGRVLDKEQIIFGNRTISSNDNTMFDFKNESPYKQIPEVKNWLFVGDGDDRFALSFTQDLIKIARGLSVSIRTPKIIHAHPDNEKVFIDIIRRAVDRSTQLVLIMVPHGDKNIYFAMKKLCIEELGVPLQCIHGSKWRKNKLNASVITKIAVQIICKLGGAPWGVAFPNAQDIMIVGVDIYHSGEIGISNTQKKKSVIGFCATLGKNQTEYFNCVALQDAGSDVARGDALAPMLKEAIFRFHKVNGVYPKHVLFYRDGTSISESNLVHLNEINPLKRTILDIFAMEDYEYEDTIKLNFVVILKNINTRLALGDYKLRNPEPGTVVDDGITNPDSLDFFIIPHHSGSGTVTPTRVKVYENESGFDADFYQGMTNKLCILYYNWFGAISIPAHCKYAHVLAKIVGQSLIQHEHENMKNVLFFV
jgi:aubergine-like protein